MCDADLKFIQIHLTIPKRPIGLGSKLRRKYFRELSDHISISRDTLRLALRYAT